MKNTVIVVSTNREMQRKTRERIGQMRQQGAQYVEEHGTADVALARCVALSATCNALRMLNAQPNGRKFDTVLMIDDDMFFELDQAQELINHTREHAMPASAAYATLNGTLAAAPIDDGLFARQLWKVGLGFLAIPAHLLLSLEAKSPKFELRSGVYAAFTSSAARSDRQWWGEDFTFTERLGGVHLLPMAVGHLKTIPIYPDDETITSLRNGVPLPKSLTAEQLNEIEGPVHVARNADGAR